MKHDAIVLVRSIYRVKKSTVMKFNGTTWVNVGNTGFSSDTAGQISIAINSTNVPYVAFIDSGNSYKTTVMKLNGTTWENVGNPGFSAGQVEYPAIAINSTGVPYVVFKDGGNSDKATVMKFVE